MAIRLLSSENITGNITVSGTGTFAGNITGVGASFVGTAASGAPLVTIENNSGSTATSYGLLVIGGGNSSNGKTFEVRDASGNPDLIVKGTGNVGIATATPQKKFHIEGTGGASEMQILVSSASDTVGHTAGIGLRGEGGEADGDFRIKGGIFFERIAGSFGNGKMILAVNSSVSNTSVTVADHALTIDTNKNVGIGTVSPTSGKLEVQQTATTAGLWVQTGGTTSSYTIADFRTGTNLSAFNIKGDGNSNFGGDVYVTGTSNSNVVISRDNMYVDGGQFYIGADNGTTDDSFRQRTASGSYFIESRKSGTWTNRLQINTAGTLIVAQGATFGGNLSFSQTSTFGNNASITNYTNGYMYIRGGSNGLVVGNNVSSTRALFSNSHFITWEINGSAAMHMDSSSRLGIGTTSPKRTLDVRGDGMSIYGTGDYTELMLRGQVEGTGTVRNVGAWHWSVRGDVGGDNDDLKLLRFVTGTYNGIAMQISNSNGNATFGGEILNAMAAPKIRLQPTTQNNASILELGVLNGGTNAYARIDAINLQNFDTNLRFWTNAPGTTTQVQRMVIESSGNVGIGTTNPSSELEVGGRAIVEKLEVARYSDVNAPAAVYIGRSGSAMGQGGIFRLGAIESSSTVNKIDEPFLITYSSGHWGSQPTFMAEFTVTYYRSSYVKYWCQHEVSQSRLEFMQGPFGGQIITGGAPASRTVTLLCNNCHAGQPVYKCVWKWSNSGTYIKTSPVITILDGPGSGRVYTSGSSTESAVDALYSGSSGNPGAGYFLMGINNAQAAGFTGLQTQN